MNPGAWNVYSTFIEKIVDDLVWLQNFQLYVSKAARFFRRFDRGNHFCRFLTLGASLGYEQDAFYTCNMKTFATQYTIFDRFLKIACLFWYIKYPRQRLHHLRQIWPRVNRNFAGSPKITAIVVTRIGAKACRKFVAIWWTTFLREHTTCPTVFHWLVSCDRLDFVVLSIHQCGDT